MASGGGSTALLQDFFVKIIGILYAYDFLTFLLKVYYLTFKTSGPRELSRDLFSTGGKWKFVIFEVFRAYLREFLIFFHEIFMVARSHQLLAADIKSLFISALVSLETRLKVPTLAIFWRFLMFVVHISACSHEKFLKFHTHYKLNII